MKHIVYLDTDYLNSYLAQLFGGIPQKSSTGSGYTKASTDGESMSVSVESEVGGGLTLKQLIEAESHIKGVFGPAETHSDKSSSEYLQELLERVLHDNALDMLIKELDSNDKLKHSLDDSVVGDFIACSFPLETLDLDFLAGLLSDKTTKLIAGVAAMEDIKKMEEDAEANGKTLSQNARKKIEDQIIALMSNNGNTRTTIEAMQAISPFCGFVYTEGAIIPIKDTYLREQLPAIDFKYSGDIHVVGVITRSDGYIKESRALDPAFNVIYDLAFDVGTSLYKGGERRIITPIALFFG